MFLAGDRWIYSASDLVGQMECSHRTALDVARAAGLIQRPETSDAMLTLAGQHGESHERRVLDQLRSEGRQVVEAQRPADSSIEALEQAAAATRSQLQRGVDVLYQGVFFDGEFQGRADFLIRVDDGDSIPRYEVYDTKLALSVKPGALLQLAAYSDQLPRAGFEMPSMMHVWLGDGRRESFPVAPVLPLLRKIRDDLKAQLHAPAAVPSPVWGEKRVACDRCAWSLWCQSGREDSRDLALVAGITASQRRKLRDAGVTTIDELAALAAGDRPDNLAESSFLRISQQAALQVRANPPADGPSSADIDMAPDREMLFEVYDAAKLSAIPRRSPGDVFFDIEGDPFLNRGAGLEYLLGAVTVDGSDKNFTEWWAHSATEEKKAFEAFVDWVEERRAKWPELHVYHYAPYELTAIRKLARRHGTREVEVDNWLRAGLLIDVYPIFRQSVRTSQPSYSIKYLEPLYQSQRTQSVTTAVDSVAEYERYLEAIQASRDPRMSEIDAAAKAFEAAEILHEIADYNRQDCESLELLVGWLRDRAAEAGVAPQEALAADESEGQPDARSTPEVVALVERLLEGVPNDPSTRSSEEEVRALIAASLGYHWREDKSSWWEHFDRLDAPLDQLAQDDSVAVITSCDATPWQKQGRARKTSRSITWRVPDGELFPFQEGDQPFLFYEEAPPGLSTGRVGGRGYVDVEVETISGDKVTVVENPRATVQRYDDLPVALAPGKPVHTDSIRKALRQFAEAYLGENHQSITAALDLLRRTPPRISDHTESPPRLVDDDQQSIDVRGSLGEALMGMDRSYVAVQGPPGSGKTWLGARVIKDLWEHGWCIGVVAQSHAVIENLLREIAAAGVSANRIGKKGGREGPWISLVKSGSDRDADPLEEIWNGSTGEGCVVGGTAWFFTSGSMLGRQPPLDLLVIDEAGQFSLANTLAVSMAAKRLLLLGDPQQLPQVSQGSHPEPVNESALGHLLNGADTIDDTLGYFLERSWRMHEEVCRPVSTLSYGGRLRAAESASGRRLEGMGPGVHGHPIQHEGRSVHSPEEVERVVELVQDALGRLWHTGDGNEAVALGQGDVLVVAPYNRQVDAIRSALDGLGLSEVRVGTVDKFQGQEAPVVVVSLTASSADEIPRGMGFLLMRNRLNVAVSRAQWASHVVYSPELLNGSIHSVEDLERVAGLLTLVGEED